MADETDPTKKSDEEEAKKPEGPARKPNTLVLSIKDKAVLYTVYMGFLKDGGIFIPTSRPFQMGQQVHMVLGLMEETERYPVTGTVIWLTPKGAQGNRAPGIGVQFEGNDGKLVRNKIETYLAGTQNSDKHTHTL